MSAGASGAVVMIRTVPGQSVRATVSFELEHPLVEGDPVVVQVDGSPTLGFIVIRPCAVLAKVAVSDTTKVVRRATQQDLYLRQRHVLRERDALRVGTMKVRERGLAMKLIRVEQAFDGSKLVFLFTAEERVDFRELVRELASEYKTRIELRQIGVRDEARLVTGYGTCGRPLCCSNWLKKFDPISIKMAKQQDLALNPSRLSGVCGRLKCCLRFELAPNQMQAAKVVADEVYPGASDDVGGCRACTPGGGSGRGAGGGP
jgi:cell fate regulator YaaT (PSP1 superfamily)